MRTASILVSVCRFPIYRGICRAIRIMRENIQKEKRSIFLGLVCELDVSVDAHAVQVVMEMADGV